VFDSNGELVTRWPLRSSAPPDLAAIDDLASLALFARRMGGSMLVRDPSPSLRELLALTGLTAVLLDGG